MTKLEQIARAITDKWIEQRPESAFDVEHLARAAIEAARS